MPGCALEADSDARICPLCEQGLDDQAFDRVKRFQAFLAGKARGDAKARAGRLQEMAEKFRKVEVSRPELITAA